MMKKLTLYIILILVTGRVFAQQETLAMDEHNKYVYYQVKQMPGMGAAQLYTGVLAGIKKNYKYTSSQIKAAPDTAFIIYSKMAVYSGQTLVKHEDGEVAYTLHVEFKQGKYRLLATDFVFNPYERNRYGVTAAVPGKEITLEAAKAKLDAKTFTNYEAQLITFFKQLAENTKNYAAETQKAPENVKKIDTKKW